MHEGSVDRALRPVARGATPTVRPAVPKPERSRYACIGRSSPTLPAWQSDGEPVLTAKDLPIAASADTARHATPVFQGFKARIFIGATLAVILVGGISLVAAGSSQSDKSAPVAAAASKKTERTNTPSPSNQNTDAAKQTANNIISTSDEAAETTAAAPRPAVASPQARPAAKPASDDRPKITPEPSTETAVPDKPIEKIPTDTDEEVADDQAVELPKIPAAGNPANNDDTVTAPGTTPPANPPSDPAVQ